MSQKPDKQYFTGYNSKLKNSARKLRKQMTKQERHLWYDFLNSYPVRFYRQRIIDHFIVDFYCSSARLIIEIDGSQHYTDEGKEYDTFRTEILSKYNLSLIRFSNNEIDRNFSGVCQEIDQKVKARLNAQNPTADFVGTSPFRGG
jgi:very-short-patch-repair endonuclease